MTDRRKKTFNGMEQSPRKNGTSRPMPVAGAQRSSKAENNIFNGKVIVIADNNKLFFKDASRALMKRGAEEVLFARTSESVWEILNSRSVDIIVCDWGIPGMHCRQLMEKMAWSEEFSKIDIIITVQSMLKGEIASIAKIGPSAILIKPFPLKVMAARIGQLLKEKMQEETTQEQEPHTPSEANEVISQAIEKAHKAIITFQTDMKVTYFDCIQRFFSTECLTAPVDLIQAATSEFDELLKNKVTTKCSTRLEVAVRGINSDVLLFRKNMSEYINYTHELLESLLVEFYVHLQDKLMESVIETAPLVATMEKTAWVVDAFRISLANKTSMLNDTLSEILDESVQQMQKISGDDSLVLHELVDAFGRGIMEPLNERFKIVDCADCSDTLRNIFPRQLCGPVLAVLKEFVFGQQKYDKANRSILKSIHLYMGRETGFEIDRLKLFFMHPKIRQYYIDSLLHCLKTLNSEIRQENFFKKINTHVQKATDGQVVFDNRTWAMLSRAWASTIEQNLGDNQRNNEAINTILNKYLYHSPPQKNPLSTSELPSTKTN